MKQFMEAFHSLGIYGYVIIGVFVLSGIIGIAATVFNKKKRTNWLNEHPGAVRVKLEVGTNMITSKQLYATIVQGEAAVLAENNQFVIYAMPGAVVVELTYNYTRPGVLHKNVSTTWGPEKVEITVESGKEYALSFDKKAETFVFAEK